MNVHKYKQVYLEYVGSCLLTLYGIVLYCIQNEGYHLLKKHLKRYSDLRILCLRILRKISTLVDQNSSVKVKI